MAGRRWGLVLLVVGGVAAGLAIAGVPSRQEDPPLRVEAGATSTTAPGGTTSTAPTASTTAPTASRVSTSSP